MSIEVTTLSEVASAATEAARLLSTGFVVGCGVLGGLVALGLCGAAWIRRGK